MKILKRVASPFFTGFFLIFIGSSCSLTPVARKPSAVSGSDQNSVADSVNSIVEKIVFIPFSKTLILETTYSRTRVVSEGSPNWHQIEMALDTCLSRYKDLVQGRPERSYTGELCDYRPSPVQFADGPKTYSGAWARIKFRNPEDIRFFSEKYRGTCEKYYDDIVEDRVKRYCETGRYD